MGERISNGTLSDLKKIGALGLLSFWYQDLKKKSGCARCCRLPPLCASVSFLVGFVLILIFGEFWLKVGFVVVSV